jgi:hypothetical protein
MCVWSWKEIELHMTWSYGYSPAYRAAVVESCPTRILLPNPMAASPGTAELYRDLGLNEAELELLAGGRPKRDYYLKSPHGSRAFELGLGPVALAFLAAAEGMTPQDKRPSSGSTSCGASGGRSGRGLGSRSGGLPSGGGSMGGGEGEGEMTSSIAPERRREKPPSRGPACCRRRALATSLRCPRWEPPPPNLHRPRLEAKGYHSRRAGFKAADPGSPAAPVVVDGATRLVTWAAP